MPSDGDDMIKYAAKKGEEMAYRYGNREQFGLFPQSIEDYVSKEDPVRVYDAFVESVDFGQLGIDIDEHQVGNSEYDPKSDVKTVGVRVLLRSEGFTEAGARMSSQSFVYLVDGGIKAGPQDDRGV